MERAIVNLKGLRSKLTTLGVTQHDLARESDLPDSAVSAILNGRAGLGARRGARLQDALHRLAVEAEARKRAEADVAAQMATVILAELEEARQQAEAEERAKQKPMPRIRRL